MKHKGELVINCARILIFLLFHSFIYVTLPVASQGASELMCVEGVYPKTIDVFFLLVIDLKVCSI